MTNGRVIIINSSIALVGIFASAFLAANLTKINELETRAYESKKEILSDLLQNTMKYSDYNHFVGTLGKDTPDVIIGKHLCDYDPSLQDAADKNGFENPCEFYVQLKLAKYSFHEITAKARVVESDRVLEQLNNMESNFDHIFEQSVREPYNLWLEPDVYNKVMGPSFNRLELLLRDELNKK